MKYWYLGPQSLLRTMSSIDQSWLITIKSFVLYHLSLISSLSFTIRTPFVRFYPPFLLYQYQHPSYDVSLEKESWFTNIISVNIKINSHPSFSLLLFLTSRSNRLYWSTVCVTGSDLFIFTIVYIDHNFTFRWRLLCLLGIEKKIWWLRCVWVGNIGKEIMCSLGF